MSSRPASNTIPEDIRPNVQRDEAASAYSAPAQRTSLKVAPVEEREALSWKAVAFTLWVCGLLLVLTRLTLSHFRLQQISRESQPLPPSPWRSLVDAVRGELGIRRSVRFLVNTGVHVPAVAGLVRPVLLLPVEWDGWSVAEQRQVLLHELAHVARWDGLAQLVGQLCCAVYWFIPLVWYGARQAAALRERACDNVVLNAGTRASSYARNLLNLAKVATGAELEPAALAMARPSRMEERVMSILDTRTRRERVTARAAVTVLALAGGIIGGLAELEPVRRTAAYISDENLSGLQQTSLISHEETPRTETRSPLQPVDRDTNLFCRRGVKSNSSTINEDDGERRWRVKVEGTGCKVDMRVEGNVEFNDEFTDIQSISRNGYFLLDFEDGGTRRELDIRPSGGSLTRVYKLNGQERPFDDEARKWFGEFLIALDRTTAVAVDIRLPRLLERGGTSAVLRETALMPSDYARSRYYTGLLESRKLAPEELEQLMDQAATLTESDFYASEILKSIGRDGLDDPGERQAVLTMIRNMDSDFYRAEVMQSLMSAGRPAESEMTMLLEVVESMESDFYQSEVLNHLMESGDLDAAQRAQIARAASGMESGFYAAEVLKGLAVRGELSETERAAFFAALNHIGDDHHRSEILSVLLQKGDPSPAEVGLILKAAGELDSDFYRGEILGGLLKTRLQESDLLAVVSAARKMDSDHYKNELLRDVLRNPGTSERVKEAVLDAAESMSNHYREEMRRAAGAI